MKREWTVSLIFSFFLSHLTSGVWITFSQPQTEHPTITILEIQLLNMGKLLTRDRITFQRLNNLAERSDSGCYDGNHETYCEVSGPNAFFRVNTNGLYFDEMIIFPRDDSFFGTLIEVSSEVDSLPFWSHRIRSKRNVHIFELGEVALSNFPVYIVDTFSYNGEVVAPFHVQYLYPVVNEFVIVESWYTHSGNRKPFLYFLQPDISAQFAPYMNKITYIVVDDMPSRPEEFVHNWLPDDRDHDSFWREDYQRIVGQRYLRAQATNSSSNITLDRTLVLCVDSDEIFDRNILTTFRDLHLYPSSSNSDGTHLFSLHQKAKFRLILFYYNFYWLETRSWDLAFLTDLRSYLLIDNFLTARISMSPTDFAIPNGGWHLSYFSSIEDIIRKIESMAHREFDLEKYKSREEVKEIVRLGKDLYHREDMKLLRVNLETTASTSKLPEGWEELQRILQEIQEWEI